ncbi:MAG: hypothetical protein ACI9MX_000881, partial [Candidatus Aldehydirespiratoraceae bacterium]
PEDLDESFAEISPVLTDQGTYRLAWRVVCHENHCPQPQGRWASWYASRTSPIVRCLVIAGRVIISSPCGFDSNLMEG